MNPLGSDPLRRRVILTGIAVWLVGAASLFAWTGKPVVDDPLLRMPGSQQGSVTILEDAGNCLGCHGGADNPSERLAYLSPGFRWQGNMMGLAARDPLMFACLTVAAQDSIAALGNPNAADLCLRCHFPKGWLAGRSDPPNASEMTGGDYDGVQCDFCHRLIDPFFDATLTGEREGADWTGYWDEAGVVSPSSAELATNTWTTDLSHTNMFTYFNGAPFYGADRRPAGSNYTESTSGQYFVAAQSQREPRASFADPGAKHTITYSRFHKSKYLCATCHDVSNPALANLGADPTNALPSELNKAGAFFHVERTFSEFMCSGYGQQNGMTGTGPYAPDIFETSQPGNAIATCQDCHMADGYGRGCNKSSGIVRKDESLEHPRSGQPLHDMTGGNIWIPTLLASTDPTSSNYDVFNENLLWQDPSVITMNLLEGVALDPVALLDGAARAQANLEAAASITNFSYNPITGACAFDVMNHTGHKLISGFPEGRRVFVNIRAYVNDALVYELNPYDESVGTLKGLPYAYSPSSPALSNHEVYVDELVYEVHPSSSFTGEAQTFHFVLADGREKDNRIPPRGFDVKQAIERLSEPCYHGQSDTNYFTAAEYAGGYDHVELTLPRAAEEIEVHLYYQTTSREYITFLRDEINGVANTLSPGSYIIQTDPWFSQLKAWGSTIWQLWDHNKHLPGAAPVYMTDIDLSLDTSDDDGDGIPAYWEVLFYGGPTNAVATADDDGDTVNNRDEYIAGTLPDDPLSVWGIDDLAAACSNGCTDVRVTFDALYSRLYTLQCTSNLLVSGSWSNAVADVAGTDASMQMVHSLTNTPVGMYRVTVRLP